MQDFPVSRLPEPLVRYMRRYFPLGHTVWLSTVPTSPFPQGITSSSDRTYHGVIFNLDTGKPDLEVVRPALNPFTDRVDSRVRLAQEEKEAWGVSVNQCFLHLGLSTPTAPSTAHIVAAQETALLYFNLADISTGITEAEALLLLALKRYASKARKEAIQTFTQHGYDMTAAAQGLVAKGYVKSLKNGLSVTPEGRYRADQVDMRRFQDADWKMRGGSWQR